MGAGGFKSGVSLFREYEEAEVAWLGLAWLTLCGRQAPLQGAH